MTTPSSGSRSELRAAMERFLQERLDGKIEKLADDDPKREEFVEEYRLANWLVSATKRAHQIKIATHTIKQIHPDAKGSIFYIHPRSMKQHDLIGSHLLSHDFHQDAVGNSAALDVYAFLQIESGGKTLLELVLDNDPELIHALSDDHEQSRKWVQVFASITEQQHGYASHPLAKQIYWLANDDPGEDSHYHLLAPLYASSLAHHIYLIIEESRFGEAAKEARLARRQKSYSEHVFHSYPNLAIQKLGGSNSQNLGSLNGKRRGTNYLLASTPPIWQSAPVQEPLHTDSAFPRFGQRPEVQRLLRCLKKLLEADTKAGMQTSNLRDHYVDGIIDELILFASHIRELEPGWSGKQECLLVEAEALWLDPHRSELDESFARQCETTDWPAEICHRFATWLNHQLKDKLPVGDAEHQLWMSRLKRNLNVLQEMLAYA